MPRAKEPRETAEARFERIQKTATEETEAELTAVRKKTARLKALRLQKESAEIPPEPTKKPARPRKKASR